MGSPDVACSNSIALARGSIKSNPASRATQAAMNAKNPCMNCSIAATPHPILLESPMPREVFPCPTIAPRRIHAKLILRIEPGGNKADSPHACLQSASDDRNGGKLPSGSVECSTICGKPMARNVVLPRQERSSQTGNHGTTPPYGRGSPPCGRGPAPGKDTEGEVDSDSLFRIFRWIPWLLSDPLGAAIGCCWTESAVRICADLGCRGNMWFL